MNAVGTLEIEKQKRIEKKAKNASFARRQTEMLSCYHVSIIYHAMIASLP